MYRYEPGVTVLYEGRKVRVLSRWLAAPEQPWYEIRYVHGRGLTGIPHAVPEQNLKEETE